MLIRVTIPPINRITPHGTLFTKISLSSPNLKYKHITIPIKYINEGSMLNSKDVTLLGNKFCINNGQNRYSTIPIKITRFIFCFFVGASGLLNDSKDPLAPRPLYNIALLTAIQPGSTFKMVTALAALEKGVDPNTPVYCAGTQMVGDRRFSCWIYNMFGVLMEIKQCIRQYKIPVIFIFIQLF